MWVLAQAGEARRSESQGILPILLSCFTNLRAHGYGYVRFCKNRGYRGESNSDVWSKDQTKSNCLTFPHPGKIQVNSKTSFSFLMRDRQEKLNFENLIR